MIGSLEGAAAAVAKEFPVFSAEGTSRMVYDACGIVYKVERNGYQGVNREEYEAMESLRDTLPDNVFLPKVSLYTVGGVEVIAMETIYGQPIAACLCEAFGDEHLDSCMTNEELDFIGPHLDDTLGMNVIRTADGKYYIIDLG